MNRKLTQLLTAFFAATLSVFALEVPDFCAKIDKENYPSALLAPQLRTENIPGKYLAYYRSWQGIPSIERTANGRLWATWYAGPTGEGYEGNFVVLYTSGDDGKTWEGPVAVYDSSLFFNARTWDPKLWKDADGNLFFSFTRIMAANKEGKDWTTWIFKAANPEDPLTKWEGPIFCGFGLSLNKPTYLKDGRIMMPMDNRIRETDLAQNIEWYVSEDKGKSYKLLSTILSDGKPENKIVCEHMLVEKNDGKLWTLARYTSGILQSESADGGKTWSVFKPFTNEFSIHTRFNVRRLKSGNLLLVANDHKKSRNNMTAFLSEDDGATWKYKFAIDERSQVSYPDSTQSDDGFIYVIYDRGRYMKDMQEILFAKITEEDIKAGKLVNEKSSLKNMINTLMGGKGAMKNYESKYPIGEHQAMIEKLKIESDKLKK